ncbi:MAG: leucine efflux protein LeuE [Pseudomonas sp.]|jgi:leucine efflux protein|uniref:leucine efflux protein LeuE n=1 Tax=Stutzerimonas stutzeri group TaxID=136846 RepID=UPI00028D659C|nr:MULTISPECIES: leucine efflux protein LeuE [Stutzerimonas stutzeri group]MBV2204259.1 leucine efflux protein LeuE [Pseudomonas sp.]EKM95516.1 leucine export protein LeuE [Stutzerimonas degradans]MCF6751109.1 leucine efflux protein LeuE [Stutzerimonas stutzeri]MEB2327733.1 leucine efflux protein LeuE [Pseudomonas sp.]NHC08696.1 leucine efflux protein LeuE [Stutzerimonas degradans]
MPTLGITDFWTYVLGVVFVVLLPGPNSLFVLATSAQRGVATGYRAACGVFLGDALLMLLSALGVASLLKAEPMLFLGLKYLGAAYLCYLGVGMLRGAWQRLRHPEAAVEHAERVDVYQPFRKALLLSLSNPKAILFFISFFIQFVDPAYAHPGLSFLVLGAVLELISALYLSFLIFTGVRLAAWFRRRQRLAAGATSGVGALFVGFGVKLATATLS